MPTIADTLRQAIKRSGKTRYRVAKDAGLHPSVILRFVSGERSLTLDTADGVVKALGLELRPARRVRKGGK